MAIGIQELQASLKWEIEAYRPIVSSYEQYYRMFKDVKRDAAYLSTVPDRIESAQSAQWYAYLCLLRNYNGERRTRRNEKKINQHAAKFVAAQTLLYITDEIDSDLPIALTIETVTNEVRESMTSGHLRRLASYFLEQFKEGDGKHYGLRVNQVLKSVSDRLAILIGQSEHLSESSSDDDFDDCSFNDGIVDRATIATPFVQKQKSDVVEQLIA